MVNPLDDPLARMAATLEQMDVRLESLDKRTGRVVFKDVFDREKEMVKREISDVRREVQILREDIEDERDHRERLGQWIVGTILSVIAIAVTLGIRIFG